MPKFCLAILLIIVIALSPPVLAAAEQKTRLRVLISTDLGGDDPDDKQSLVHALLYADRLDIVALVSTPTGGAGRVEDILEVINIYELDYPKLKTWSAEYPTPDSLRRRVFQGRIEPQPPQGYSSATEGSMAIIRAAREAAAARTKLWVLLWGAATDLAQALYDAPQISSYLRVYLIGSWNTAQDRNARNYIASQHRDLWWIENDTTFRGIYSNREGKEWNAWRREDAQGHGALGDYFHQVRPWGLKMGDTPSLLYLIHGDPENPESESWGGSFVRDRGRGRFYWRDDLRAREAYPGAESIRRYQAEIYRDIAEQFDRARAARP